MILTVKLGTGSKVRYIAVWDCRHTDMTTEERVNYCIQSIKRSTGKTFAVLSVKERPITL